MIKSNPNYPPAINYINGQGQTVPGNFVDHLEQENGALKAALFRAENPIFRKTQDALMKEDLKFDNYRFLSDTAGHVFICKANATTFSKPKLFSECYNFRCKAYLNETGGLSSYEVFFTTPAGRRSMFSISGAAFTSKKAFAEFSKAGGSVCYSNSEGTASFFLFAFISKLIDTAELALMTPHTWLNTPNGWYCDRKAFKDSDVFLGENSLKDKGSYVHSLAKAIGFLHERICLRFRQPLFFITNEPVKATVSLSTPTKRFLEILESTAKGYVKFSVFQLMSDTGYAQDKARINLALLDEALHNEALTFFPHIYSRDVNAYTKRGLSIAVSHLNPGACILSVKDLRDAVINHPDGFEKTLKKAYDTAFGRIESCHPARNELAVISAFSAVFSWALSMNGKDDLAKEVENVGGSYIELLTKAWDKLSPDDIITDITDSIYNAVARHEFRVWNRMAMPEDADYERDACYSENSLFIRPQVLTEILARLFPEYEDKELLQILKEEGCIICTNDGDYSANRRIRLLNGEYMHRRYIAFNLSFLSPVGKKNIIKL